MILKTIEFIPTDISTTLDSLQDDVNAGKYDDILNKYCFLTLTEKGLTLVKQDKTLNTNMTVDLSEYAKKSDLPSLSFEEDGTLLVTIGNKTNRYSPNITT